MKRVRNQVIANFIFSFVLILVWFLSIQIESGGLCEYWRCITPNIRIFETLLIIFGIANVLMLYGEIYGNKTGQNN